MSNLQKVTNTPYTDIASIIRSRLVCVKHGSSPKRSEEATLLKSL